MLKINRAIFQNLNKTIFRSFHKNLVVKKDMDAKITTEDENNQLKSENKKNNDEETLVNADGELANKNVNPGCGDDDSENNPVAKKQKLDEKEVSTSTTNPADDENQTKSTLKKRKYALLLGYCGEGYFGLQRYQDRQKLRLKIK
jgi:hypothetical protein